MKALYQLPAIDLDSIVDDEVDYLSPILDDVCLPPHYGPKDHDDLLPLLKIVRSRQPRNVIELGTAFGNTVANICRQCSGAKVYTVNSLAEQQSGNLTTYELTREEIGRVYKKYGFADQVVQIFINSLDLDLSKFIDGNVVDLVVIDACHDTEYVLNDFHKVEPFISPGGIVLFHDTHPSMKSQLLGSYLACMTLRRRGYDIRHLKNTWWAIWVNDGGRSN